MLTKIKEIAEDRKKGKKRNCVESNHDRMVPGKSPRRFFVMTPGGSWAKFSS